MNKPQSNLYYKKGYGKNFANLRKKEYNGKEDYTVRGLAEKLKIASSTISLIEKEQRIPTIEQINMYKGFFGVSLDYLVGETNIIKASKKAICEYTGLSEKAINALNRYKDDINHELTSDILNALISDENFYDLVSYIYNFESDVLLKEYLRKLTPALINIARSNWKMSIREEFFKKFAGCFNLNVQSIYEDREYFNQHPDVNWMEDYSMNRTYSHFNDEIQNRIELGEYRNIKKFTFITSEITTFYKTRFEEYARSANELIWEFEFSDYFDTQDHENEFKQFIKSEFIQALSQEDGCR